MIKMNGSALSSGQRSDGNFQAIPKARGGDSDINLAELYPQVLHLFSAISVASSFGLYDAT